MDLKGSTTVALRTIFCAKFERLEIMKSTFQDLMPLPKLEIRLHLHNLPQGGFPIEIKIKIRYTYYFLLIS